MEKIRCSHCNKIIYRYYCRLKQFKKHFCNVKCKNKHDSICYKGEKNPHYGKHHSLRSKKIISKASLGINNGRWRGGKKRTSLGYILILRPAHPNANIDGRVYEHRLVMEKKLKRYLMATEVVHHENGITSDNRIKNLKLFKNKTEHTLYHNIRRRKNAMP